MTPYIRILLRYAAAYFVARGVLGQDMADALTGDPELVATLELLVGLAIGAATEGWYWFAKRMGWAT